MALKSAMPTASRSRMSTHVHTWRSRVERAFGKPPAVEEALANKAGLRSLAAFVVGLPQVAGFQEPARLPMALAAKLIASASRAALKMKESRP